MHVLDFLDFLVELDNSVLRIGAKYQPPCFPNSHGGRNK